MPRVFVIGGCNGAGKTTASRTILPEILDCREFVNADEIASALAPGHPQDVSIKAGRLMLKRIQYLADERADFAFETTLSTKSYVPFLKNLQNTRYILTLIYFYLSSPELALERVARRVHRGGHSIPEETLRRRYTRGMYNRLR